MLSCYVSELINKWVSNGKTKNNVSVKWVYNLDPTHLYDYMGVK